MLPFVRTGVWVAFLLYLLMEVLTSLTGDAPDPARLAGQTFRVLVGYTGARAVDALLRPR